GYKFNDWEQKGVPLRLEIGPNDIAKSQILTVRRDSGVKAPIPLDFSSLPTSTSTSTTATTPAAISTFTTSIAHLLDTIQADLYTRAKEEYDSHIVEVTEWDKFVPALDAKNVVVMPWCDREACEDDVKERSGRAAEPQDERAPSAGAKTLCIPFDQSRWAPIEPGKTKCPACGQDAKHWTLFGRSY
ncbi:hypothetical protein CVT26_006155, partial [Gymnopilus dilepis]